MKKQTSGSGQAPQWDSNWIGMGYHGILLGLGLLAHPNARMLSAGSMVFPSKDVAPAVIGASDHGPPIALGKS